MSRKKISPTWILSPGLIGNLSPGFILRIVFDTANRRKSGKDGEKYFCNFHAGFKKIETGVSGQEQTIVIEGSISNAVERSRKVENTRRELVLCQVRMSDEAQGDIREVCMLKQSHW